MTKMEMIRKEKGYTQKFMAENIHSSVGSYNMYENNQRKIPKAKAEKITEILGCEVEDIFVPCNFTSCETARKNYKE